MMTLLSAFGDLLISGPKGFAKEKVFDLHMMHVASNDLAAAKLYFHVNFVCMTNKKLYKDMQYIYFNLIIFFSLLPLTLI